MAEYDVTIKGKYLTYRGLPLVREGNTICYGSMEDKYILYLFQPLSSIQMYMNTILTDTDNNSNKHKKLPQKSW